MNEITVRAATLADAAGIARVHVDTWRTAYRGLVPDEHLDALSYEKCEVNWVRFLTEARAFRYVAQGSDGTIVGFASAGTIREPVGDFSGEVYSVYVAQAHQRQGVGGKLLAAAADDLLDHGIESLVIWSLAENPCRAFYEKLGGLPVAEKTVEIGGRPLREIAYGWMDIRTMSARHRGESHDRMV